MPRIPVHTAQDIPTASQDAVSRLTKNVGHMTNMLAELVDSPAIVEMYTANRAILAQFGTFDGRTREAIALAMANQNECDYCEAAHTRSGRRVLSDEEMIAIRSGEVKFDPKLAAMTEFVRDAAANVGDVSDAVWQAALDAGWTEGDLAEAFAHIASNVFNNFFNRFARTELDVPAAPPLTH